MLRLSVIIVSWNVRDLLLNCLRSLREQMQLSPSEWEVIIVDNGSSDGTVEAVRQLDVVELARQHIGGAVDMRVEGPDEEAFDGLRVSHLVRKCTA